MIAGDVAHLLAVFLAAELVDERADQPRRRRVELAIRSAPLLVR